MISIDDLHEELKQIHKNYFPHMRFGHFISGFMSWLRSETSGKRILFLDDDEVFEYIKKYDHVLKDTHTKNEEMFCIEYSSMWCKGRN